MLDTKKTSNYSPLLHEIQLRACRFFWDNADRSTGLVKDRASNHEKDDYTVSSIASTGYALAALAIAVEHGWQSYNSAYDRASLTLEFIDKDLFQIEGWYYHFVEKSTGARIWECEVSSIDTALLVIGALICGQYFGGTVVETLANKIYNKVNWEWMLTNDGALPDKLLLSHGWRPESGFIKHDWDSYCELMHLYILGMGAENTPLSAESWNAWQRPVIEYKGMKTLHGGPIFIHQMSHGFYNFKDHIDRHGWDYWTSSYEATHINRQYCIDKMPLRKTYSSDVWGINACDYPGGYKAFSAPGDEDGTISPTGAIASIIFTPELSTQAADAMFNTFKDRMWGQYGFSNSFNLDQNWYDKDVIGIDLGMAMVNIENAVSGLIWSLLSKHSSTAKGWKSAGFKRK